MVVFELLRFPHCEKMEFKILIIIIILRDAEKQKNVTKKKVYNPGNDRHFIFNGVYIFEQGDFYFIQAYNYFISWPWLLWVQLQYNML